ncbi:MAG: hypothetical protein Q8R83_05125 [Legionellaceae bacterium]|nr:hypothetical protein [Legionellaceae bacterium]
MLSKQEFDSFYDDLLEMFEDIVIYSSQKGMNSWGAVDITLRNSSKNTLLATAIYTAFQPKMIETVGGAGGVSPNHLGYTNDINFRVLQASMSDPLFTRKGREDAYKSVFDSLTQSVQSGLDTMLGDPQDEKQVQAKSQIHPIVQAKIRTLKQSFDKAETYLEKNESLKELGNLGDLNKIIQLVNSSNNADLDGENVASNDFNYVVPQRILSKRKYKEILDAYQSTSILVYLRTWTIFAWLSQPKSQTMRKLEILLGEDNVTHQQIIDAVTTGDNVRHRLALFKDEPKCTKNGSGTDEVITKLKDYFTSP